MSRYMPLATLPSLFLRRIPAICRSPLSSLNALASKLMTEPVRYGKPGLQAHITYLANMTANVDQKIGRDAIERYAVLKKELDQARAEFDRIQGAASSSGAMSTQ
jgi:hypothetical protein